MVDLPELAVMQIQADFDNLHEDYRQKVYRLISRLVSSPLDAEDLTQETFLKAATNLAHIKHPEHVAAWLYRIATNTALDYLRRTRCCGAKDFTQVSLEARKPIPTDTPAPAISLDGAESADCIRQYADQLPEQYRIVLILHYLEGLPLAQVAEVMGSSVGATKVRLHRARKRFEEICSAECEQFYNEAGVLSCQPKSTVPLDSEGNPCCDPYPADCACT